MTQPSTAAEILALPIGPVFAAEVIVRDGRTCLKPIAPAVEVIWVEGDQPFMARDEDGVLWALAKYAGGEYFRRRVYV